MRSLVILMIGIFLLGTAFSQSNQDYQKLALDWAQDIWGDVKIDKGVTYYDRNGNPAVYGFTVLLDKMLKLTSSDILSQVSEARSNRLIGEKMLEEGSATGDADKINKAYKIINSAWAAMRNESLFATIYMSASPERSAPVKFYAGLPLHYVTILDAKEMAKKRLKANKVTISRFLYDGLFQFFVELKSGNERTIVDLLELENSFISENTLLTIFEPDSESPKSKIYSDLEDSPEIILSKYKCDYTKSQRYINGVPDYQTIYGRGCAPAASGCVLGYWDDNGYDRMVDGGDSGYAGQECDDGYLTLIWCELANAMDYVEGVGTYISKVDNGIRHVANVINNYSFNVSNGTWYSQASNDRSAYRSEIQAGYPFVYTIKHPNYGGGAGYHSTTAMGYYELYFDPPCSSVHRYRVVHDNNTGTGVRVYLNEEDIIGSTHIITVHPGGLSKMTADDGSVAPQQLTFSLESYPNPFNPATTIEYTLVNTSPVYLNIYNLQGQLIQTFNMGTQEAGGYAVHWEGRNQHGDAVSSGVYLIELKTSTHRLIRKVSLLK